MHPTIIILLSLGDDILIILTKRKNQNKLIGKELLYLMQDEVRDRKQFKKAFAWEYVSYWIRSETARLKSYLFSPILMLKYRKLNEQMMPIAAMNHIMTISGKGLIISSIFLMVWSFGGRLSEGEM